MNTIWELLKALIPKIDEDRKEDNKNGTSIPLSDLVAAFTVINRQEKKILLVCRRDLLTFPTGHMMRDEEDLQITLYRESIEELKTRVKKICPLGTLLSPNPQGRMKLIEIFLCEVDEIAKVKFKEGKSFWLTFEEFLTMQEQSLDNLGRTGQIRFREYLETDHVSYLG